VKVSAIGIPELRNLPSCSWPKAAIQEASIPAAVFILLKLLMLEGFVNQAASIVSSAAVIPAVEYDDPS
jgi:hypothetical protein